MAREEEQKKVASIALGPNGVVLRSISSGGDSIEFVGALRVNSSLVFHGESSERNRPALFRHRDLISYKQDPRVFRPACARYADDSIGAFSDNGPLYRNGKTDEFWDRAVSKWQNARGYEGDICEDRNPVNPRYALPFTAKGFYQALQALCAANEPKRAVAEGTRLMRELFEAAKNKGPEIESFMYLDTLVDVDHEKKTVRHDITCPDGYQEMSGEEIPIARASLPQHGPRDSALRESGFCSFRLARRQSERALGAVDDVPEAARSLLQALFGTGYERLGAVLQYAAGPINGELPEVRFCFPDREKRGDSYAVAMASTQSPTGATLDVLLCSTSQITSFNPHNPKIRHFTGAVPGYLIAPRAI